VCVVVLFPFWVSEGQERAVELVICSGSTWGCSGGPGEHVRRISLSDMPCSMEECLHQVLMRTHVVCP
jgi:hypothetical protein